MYYRKVSLSEAVEISQTEDSLGLCSRGMITWQSRDSCLDILIITWMCG